MNQADLYNAIYNALITIHPRVYLERAPQGAVTPYVTWKIPNMTPNQWRDDHILEISVWDKSTKTAAIETLTDSLNATMDRLTINTGAFDAHMHLINRLVIPDPDPDIKRRELRYQILLKRKEVF